MPLNTKTALLAASLIMLSLQAQAACTSPSRAEGAVIYSASAKQLQFCDGTNWVNTGATTNSVGGGGGVPTYAGYASVDYDGTQDISGMDAACASAFSGGRMLRASDYKYVSTQIDDASDKPPYGAVYHCDNPAENGACIELSHDQLSLTNMNCTAWSYHSTGTYAFVLNANYSGNNKVTTQACNSSYAPHVIHCVTD